MKTRLLVFVLIAAVTLGCASDHRPIDAEKAGLTIAAQRAGKGTPEPSRPTTIGVGMILEVVVQEERAFPRQHVVLPNGTVELPLIGRVPVEGLEPEEAAAKIKEALERDFYSTATVTVQILSTAARTGGIVYVTGAVGKQGPVGIPQNELYTVAKVILAAGGLGQFANGRNVQLVRADASGNKKRYRVDVLKVLKEGNPEADVPVENGDWIVVPEKLFNF
jgi:polysaccharide export outer membrane protein